jgi:hypothetical protein
MSLFKGFDAKQAVLIDFDITGLADPVSRIDELETILNHTLGPFGESDGHELGGGEGRIFLYGADAEKMFTRIESVLKSDPLCKNARVTVRQGEPGSPQHEIQL